MAIIVQRAAQTIAGEGLWSWDWLPAATHCEVCQQPAKCGAMAGFAKTGYWRTYYTSVCYSCAVDAVRDGAFRPSSPFLSILAAVGDEMTRPAA